MWPSLSHPPFPHSLLFQYLSYNLHKQIVVRYHGNCPARKTIRSPQRHASAEETTRPSRPSRPSRGGPESERHFPSPSSGSRLRGLTLGLLGASPVGLVRVSGYRHSPPPLLTPRFKSWHQGGEGWLFSSTLIEASWAVTNPPH